MESLLKNLEKHVTCSICLDTFTEPKTIECLHTFCFECLKRHALTTHQQGIFRCPECQARIDVPQRFDKLPTGFLQNSLLDLLAVQKGGDGSEISCGNCRKNSAETSFCFECEKFMCSDCVNAHELLRNVAFEGHKVRPIKHFKEEDYEALLKRQSFCSQQYHEREIMKFYCVDCETCVCQTCINTDHKNHAIDPLNKAAGSEKAKLTAAIKSIKEKSKLCSDVIRQFEQTAVDVETNANAAKPQVSQTADQMIAKIRDLEREAIIAVDTTRVLRLDKLNEAKDQLQCLLSQVNQAIEYASNLVQRSSSSDIMQSKETLEKRFEDLDKTTIPAALPVASYLKFVSAAETEKLTLGVITTEELAIKGLTQDFQAGVEAELVICPKLMRRELFHPEVLVEPTEQVGSLITRKNEDGTLSSRFVAKVKGTYNISVSLKGVKLHKNPFLIQVKERRLKVVGELDLQGQTLESSEGIAVNSKGLIAVTDFVKHCILMFDKEGKYLRRFGRKGEKSGELNRPSGLTFVDDDNILVADTFNHRIQQFNVQTGYVVKSFGSEGSRDGEFEKPFNVCIDDEGRIAVAEVGNKRIQVFTKDGELLFTFGDSGSGKLHLHLGCIFHENRFIFSDVGYNCLKVFDRSGKFLCKIGEEGNGDGQLNSPWGLCVEKCGTDHHNILVCDSGNDRIVQLSVKGSSFTGKSVGELPRPRNIATTPDGRILVTDSGAKKVSILK
ncbi:E3 ubiquitin-protein ligase TRIM71-like [Montipora capricornis]|uniref:E3 ubiquitin-protein ligase TRIM71-like n=1 Tax=Montipora capricornis TaxID=246305 RepID=UPI0035F1241D